MNPLSPLIAAGELAVLGVGAYSAYKGLTGDSSKPSPSPYNPSRTPVPTKSRNSALKGMLSKYSDEVVGVALSTIATAKTGALAIDEFNKTLAQNKKAENDALKASLAQAPLVKNQIEIKASIDELISAIHSQTVASVALFGTLDNNLKSIGSTLMAISSTLIDISDNYAEQIEKADDLPFIDTKTFYEIMEKKGLDKATSFNLQNEEDSIRKSMDSQGSTYSDIKSALTQFRKASISPDLWFGLTGDVAGITAPSPIASNGSVASSPDLSKLNDWADSALEDLQYKKTPLPAPDTSTETGTLELSPRDASHAKNLHTARGQADENSIGGDLISHFDELLESIDPEKIKLPAYSSISEMLSAIGVDDLNAYANDLKTKYGVQK